MCRTRTMVQWYRAYHGTYHNGTLRVPVQCVPFSNQGDKHYKYVHVYVRTDTCTNTTLSQKKRLTSGTMVPLVPWYSSTVVVLEYHGTGTNGTRIPKHKWFSVHFSNQKVVT
jgi:hypothetical protein